VAAIFKFNTAANTCEYHVAIGTIGLLAPKKHTVRYQNQVNGFIMSIDNSKRRFQVAAIFKSNMADMKRKFQVAQYLQNVRNVLVYTCAKIGACITECTILLNIWDKPPHYKVR